LTLRFSSSTTGLWFIPNRGASPLELPCTRPRSPLRRSLRSRGSLAALVRGTSMARRVRLRGRRRLAQALEHHRVDDGTRQPGPACDMDLVRLAIEDHEDRIVPGQ